MKKTFAFMLILLMCASTIIAFADKQSQEPVFSDIDVNDWFYEDIKFVYENSLMSGISETNFSPEGNTTRGMIVTVLWRLEGKPAGNGNKFDDVNSDEYYYDAVSWASENGIVNGYSETEFGPNDTTTREQFATIMYRYATFKDADISKKANLDGYADKEEISTYAYESIQWANANGIISGTSADTISPKDNIERCQVAAILKRFCENFGILKLKTDDEKQESSEITNESQNTNTNLSGNSSSSASIGTSGGSSGTLPRPSTGSSTQDTTDNSQGTSSDSSQNENNPPIEEEVIENIVRKHATIRLNTTYGKPGETLFVVVELAENPGILGMTLSLEYDEEVLTLVDIQQGNAVSDVLTLTHSKDLASGMSFSWDGVDLTPNSIKTGTLLTFQFDISPDAVIGKRYPFRLDYKPGSVVDTDLNKINLRIYQGYLEIEAEEYNN